jgi:hypothetical protein
MEQDYVTPSDKKMSIVELKNYRSKQIISSIDAFGGTILLLQLLQGKNNDEFLILKFLPDVPNNPINDIRQEEVIVIVTSRNNLALPKVFACRDNFPLGLPHTNATKDKRPVSLCIFEDNFEELKHKWSGPYFLHAIKSWLELTARNELHVENQPLEPFFIGSNSIIVNPDNHYIKELPNGFYKTTDSTLGTPIHRLFIATSPVDNGVVNQNVTNLYALKELFKSKNIDLLELMKPKTTKLVDYGLKHRSQGDYWKGLIVLIIEIPILRNVANSEPTLCGFKINVTLGELSNIFGRTIMGFDELVAVEENLSEVKLTSIRVEILNPHLSLNKILAQTYSGIDRKYSESKFTLIGLGAIGSQFFMNLARGGIGIWNLIDKDILLPHNFIRHASTNIENHLAKNKATAISEQANDLLNDADFSKPFAANIFEVDKSIIQGSDIIIDMSTSIGVERYLSNEIKGVRKLSAFLNPMGTDLVMLTEDVESYYPLDILEIQYYKEILTNSELFNHLDFIQDGKIRYARGCRDITSKIPQENLSIFSGIASKAFKQILNNRDAGLQIWRANESQGVIHHRFNIEDWQEKSILGWTIYINENYFLNTISEFRVDKLPNETGGILIGAIDYHYKKIYIIQTILAPEDSVERPTLFIRGIKGVNEKLEQINSITNDNLKYLGEWHSHPKNCGLGMSNDDKIQFTELLLEAKLNGQPAIMIILGDDNKFKIYIDNYEL